MYLSSIHHVFIMYSFCIYKCNSSLQVQIFQVRLLQCCSLHSVRLALKVIEDGRVRARCSQVSKNRLGSHHSNRDRKSSVWCWYEAVTWFPWWSVTSCPAKGCVQRAELLSALTNQPKGNYIFTGGQNHAVHTLKCSTGLKHCPLCEKHQHFLSWIFNQVCILCVQTATFPL